jgi:hypothetical protein
MQNIKGVKPMVVELDMLEKQGIEFEYVELPITEIKNPVILVPYGGKVIGIPFETAIDSDKEILTISYPNGVKRNYKAKYPSNQG